MTGYGALQPVADDAAYGRRCPLRDLRGRLGNWLDWVALRPSRQAPGPLATTVKLGRASAALVLCTTLNAATGLLRPFSSRFPRSSSLATALTASAIRLLTRICPSLASAQSRAARLHTVPIAV